MPLPWNETHMVHKMGKSDQYAVITIRPGLKYEDHQKVVVYSVGMTVHHYDHNISRYAHIADCSHARLAWRAAFGKASDLVNNRTMAFVKIEREVGLSGDQCYCTAYAVPTDWLSSDFERAAKKEGDLCLVQ